MRASLSFRLHLFPSLLVAAGLLFAAIGSAGAARAQIADPPPDEVVVKPKAGVPIGAILSRYNATLIGTLTETNLYFLKLPSGQTADQVLPALEADAELHYAEPNYYSDSPPGGGHIMFGGHMAPLAEHIMFGGHGEPTATPGAENGQWAWSRVGLPDAQKISRGQGVIVAVLDTGLAPDHPLLSSSLVAGYDFVGMSNSIYDHGNGLDDSGNGLADEFVGHGTHVSGIIVTEAPGVQIMPIRVLNSDGVGTYWEVAAGIKFAVDHGARVINMSLSAPRLTPSLAEALDYAAAHGVIVVAAAGTGPGPNYPAAYTGAPDVIGVGASDLNDATAWFSGGRAADTDVFAPGVGIYSAYPYNGFGPGSGTSMAAPIVSGEAALLISRYPFWDPGQLLERIWSQTDPVAGASAGRVNLGRALSTGLHADYAVGDIGTPNDNHIKPHIRLVNNTAEDIPLSQLQVRYWYNLNSTQAQTLNCDYSTIGCGGVTGTFVSLSPGHPNRTPASDAYLEAGFSSSAGLLPGGGQVELYLRINKVDWSNYAEAGSYSYGEGLAALTRWDRITIYRNGALVWGAEPSGGPAGATNTATLAAPSASPTRTASPQPSPTATRTSTPAPPPATSTPTRTASPQPSPTATRTPTAAPATPTRTATPAGASPTASGAAALKIQYLPVFTTSSHQSIAPKLILVNTGSASVPLQEVKIRYWYTLESPQPQSYWCDYAAIGCANVSAQFVQMQSARPGADHYLELSFAGGAGSLAPGANSGQLHSRFSKNDWSYYVQTGDHSFDPSLTQFSDWNRITVYRNGVLVWGVEP